MRNSIIFLFFALWFIHAYADKTTTNVAKIEEYTTIASNAKIPDINAQKTEQVAYLVLLKWDSDTAKYKTILCHFISSESFDEKLSLGDSYVNYTGKYDRNSIVLELHYFENINNEKTEIYSINTNAQIHNAPITLLSWSNPVSRTNETPEFLCFVRLR